MSSHGQQGRAARAAPVLIALVCTALPAPARADFMAWQWAAALDLGSQYDSNTIDDDPAGGDDVHRGVGTIDLRGIAGPGPIGVAAAFDVAVGFEVPGAFVYAMHLSPVGVSARLWERAYLGVVAGAGFGGAANRLPFAGVFPVRAFLELDLGRYVRALADARVVFTAGSDARDGGSQTVDGVDEAQAAFGLGFGKRETDYMAAWSDLTYVGVVAREQLGERFYGVELRVSLNGTSRDR